MKITLHINPFRVSNFIKIIPIVLLLTLLSNPINCNFYSGAALNYLLHGSAKRITKWRVPSPEYSCNEVLGLLFMNLNLNATMYLGCLQLFPVYLFSSYPGLLSNWIHNEIAPRTYSDQLWTREQEQQEQVGIVEVALSGEKRKLQRQLKQFQ